MAKKILIVDDDESILGACEMTLNDAGYDVKTVDGDGAVVVQNTQTYKPDLIFIDLILSGSDGGSVVKELKNTKETKKIPVLLISSYANLGEVAQRSGADGYLAKPFEVRDLMRAIETYITK